MNPPKILFIANDPLLATCYAEALSKSGFHVSVALDGETGLQRFTEMGPDAVIMDLKLPKMGSAQVITAIRAHERSRGIPVVGLPTELEALVQEAQAAGLTKQLERFANPVASLVRAVESLLEVGTSHNHSPSPSQTCLARCEEEIAGGVTRLRLSLQTATNPANPIPQFGELLQSVHNFSELAALLKRQAVFQVASALEVLVWDLTSMPEQVNPSVLRTIGQAIDFLCTLLNLAAGTTLKPSNQSRVMIIEDDSNARQLISAAMQLVGLEAASAGDAASGLAALEGTPMDLIFLDIGLPGLDGFELCKKIRSIATHKSTPIVFLTGMATFQNRVKSSLSGGNDFIGKPFSLNELGVKSLFWVYKGQLGMH